MLPNFIFIFVFIMLLSAYQLLYLSDLRPAVSDAMAIPISELEEHHRIGTLKINGVSYGNSGLRFMTFAECLSNHNYLTKYFSGGSDLTISATLSNSHSASESEAIGSWQLNLHKYGESSEVIKNGTFYSGTIIHKYNGDPVGFVLHGVELTDTACGGAPKHVTITGSCSVLTPLHYTEEDGDKIGSLTASNAYKIFYLITYRMACM